eukprot:1937936-Prymnesium_polylepis.1
MAARKHVPKKHSKSISVFIAGLLTLTSPKPMPSAVTPIGVKMSTNDRPVAMTPFSARPIRPRTRSARTTASSTRSCSR